MSGRYSEQDQRALRPTAPPHPPAHQGAPDLRRRRRRRGRDRRPGPVHLCSVEGDAVVKVMAMKARPLGRKGVVVGDRVRVVGDTSGEDGALARIVEVDAATTTLRRTADDDDPVERVIVSNADQLVVVDRAGRPRAPTAPDRPCPGGGVRRRHAAAAVPDQGRPGRPRDLLSTYRSLGVPWVVTQRGGDLSEVRERLARAHQRADRAQRRRQVHAGQRPGARRPPRGRAWSTP